MERRHQTLCHLFLKCLLLVAILLSNSFNEISTAQAMRSLHKYRSSLPNKMIFIDEYFPHTISRNDELLRRKLHDDVPGGPNPGPGPPHFKQNGSPSGP
ncbi:unnamed protein product [Cuscuta epithymum]|uniref:Uncharacterized protein n=1 Tax=Cuscuta epithymum TaxID=186058 RepID=A0AAV0FIU9_9ASTE|nr:unnamed protein product [Cuscuta epithymum]